MSMTVTVKGEPSRIWCDYRPCRRTIVPMGLAHPSKSQDEPLNPMSARHDLAVIGWRSFPDALRYLTEWAELAAAQPDLDPGLDYCPACALRLN